MDKEMELLLSEKELVINDKRIVVKRIALLDTIRLAARLSEIVSIALNSSEAVTSALYKISYSGNPNVENETDESINSIRITGLFEIFGILGEDGTSLLKDVIVKSTNLSDVEAEQIDCVDGIDLISTIVEVNAGFFKKLSNKLKEKLKKKEKNEEKEEK